jgi:hypothetical protein
MKLTILPLASWLLLLPLALATCGGSSPGDTATVTDAEPADADAAVDGDADATDLDTATDTTDAVVPDVAPDVVDAAEVDVPDVPDVLPDLPDVPPDQVCTTNKVCSYTAAATGKPFCARNLSTTLRHPPQEIYPRFATAGTTAGGLIHTASGSGGKTGAPWTKRFGFAA